MLSKYEFELHDGNIIEGIAHSVSDLKNKFILWAEQNHNIIPKESYCYMVMSNLDDLPTSAQYLTVEEIKHFAKLAANKLNQKGRININ